MHSFLLHEVLSPLLIEIGLEAGDKWEVLEKMSKILARSGKVKDADLLHKDMVDREKICSTGLGRGVAIPHSPTDAVTEIVIAAATIKEPIDFQSADETKTRLVFAIASPKDKGPFYALALQKISKIVRMPNVNESLYASKTNEEFLQILRNAEMQ